LILEGVTTLRELETYYSIDDMQDRNDALDAKADAIRRANKDTSK
jgi:hypothetical protein